MLPFVKYDPTKECSTCYYDKTPDSSICRMCVVSNMAQDNPSNWRAAMSTKPSAHIIITDLDNGNIDVSIKFVPSLQRTSNAHAATAFALNALKEWADKDSDDELNQDDNDIPHDNLS